MVFHLQLFLVQNKKSSTQRNIFHVQAFLNIAIFFLYVWIFVNEMSIKALNIDKGHRKTGPNTISACSRVPEENIRTVLLCASIFFGH